MSEKEINRIIADNLVHQMSIHNCTQLELAQYMGVSQATVSNWCKGIKLPRMSKVDKICDFFHINRSDLLVDNQSEASTSTGTALRPRTVKVYGRIAGGVPIEMIEDVIDEVDLTTVPVKPGQKYFGLKVSGHSMEPDIKDGDYIICIQADDAESGSIVAATVNGNDATCKRIMKYQDGIRLLPINPSYDVQYYTNKEVEELPVRVIGVVVESRHRYI